MLATAPAGSWGDAERRELGVTLNSGEPLAFQYPSVGVPTLFTGADGLEIVVPAGARRLEISVATTTPAANLDLFVRHGTPPSIAGGQVVADFSATGYSGYEAVTISAASNPPLQAGTYSIAVAVRTTGTVVAGSITATYSTTDDYSGKTLETGTPASFSFPASANPTLYLGTYLYRIEVPAGATRLEVMANAVVPSQAADIDLYVRRGTPPVASNGQVTAAYRSANPQGLENVVVTSSSAPPLQAGTYFVALGLFTTGTPVEGMVQATVESGVGPPPAAEPALAVSATSLSFSANVGSNPAPQSVSVRNSGDGTLNYTVQSNAGWLALNPAAGASTGEADTITVSVDASGLASGTYNATITVDAGAAGSAAVNVTLTMNAVGPPPGGNAPVIGAGGVVNAADYTATIAEGMIFSIFGSDLAPATAEARDIPLPTTLEGVSVEVLHGGAVINAPLFFVSLGQINAQLPFGLGGAQIRIRVRNADGLSNEETVTVSAAAPRLFTQTTDGRGEAILVHADYKLVTPENPGRAGEWVVLYLTGLGDVDPPLAAGQAGGDGGSAGPLNRVAGNVVVLMDGVAVNVFFAGLAPNFVGLYQINFQIPAGVLAGMARISVRRGEAASQEEITFACSVTYKPISSVTLGPAGGTVSGGGISVEIPAGALGSNQEISLYQVTGRTTLSNDASDPIYALGGLPENYKGKVTVTMEVAGEPPPPGESYLVMMEEAGTGGELWVEAQVDGNVVTGTVDLEGGGPPAAQGAAADGLRAASGNRPATVLDRANQGIDLWQFTRGIRTETSPSERFRVTYHKDKDTPAKASRLARTFDEADQKLATMGFQWPDGTGFPIVVNLISHEFRGERHLFDGFGEATRSRRKRMAVT
ncbi:MAG: hypothetical protein GY953_13570, partial [bacterium]|nr:hypothetical protein [bacterium]